jgi:hypothetical protein
MQCVAFPCIANVIIRVIWAALAASKTREKRGSGSMRGNDSQLVVRLPATLVARVDAFAERMRAELPGTRFARAEAVRVLLTRALDQLKPVKA